MTPTQEQAIREAAERATPGPWRSMRQGNQVINGSSLVPTGVAASVIPELPRPWNPAAVIAFMKLDAAEEARFLDADADFIALSRTAIPDLLAALDAERAEVERLRDDHRHMEWLYRSMLDQRDHLSLDRARWKSVACALAFDHGRLMEEAAAMWPRAHNCPDAWKGCECLNPYRPSGG